MKILAFDPASSTGFAVLENGKHVTSGVCKFSYPSEAQQRKGRAKGERWLRYWGWIGELLQTHRPDLVVAEDVRRHVSTLAGHAYGFYRYAIEAQCASSGASFLPLGVSQWKALSTRSGSAGKVSVAEAMRALYGDIQFLTDDQSDALGIAHAAQALHDSGRIVQEGSVLRALEPNPKGRRRPARGEPGPDAKRDGKDDKH